MSDNPSDDKKFNADELNAEQAQSTKKVWPTDQPDATPEPTADESSMDQDEESTMEALEFPNHNELEAKLTETEQQMHEYWNKFTRAQAEMENIVRRAERDVANAHKYGNEKLLTELLTVMDSLERGLEGKAELEGDSLALRVYEGLELTRDMMMSTMEKFGVVQIHPKGETFNPSQHEAISMVESDQPSNTIIEVMQPGYSLNERLIRPAMVVVAK